MSRRRGEIALVGAAHGEPRGELDHEQTRGQDVLEQVRALGEIRRVLEERRQELERAGLTKVGDGDALSVAHRDEARLLEHAHGLAERVAVRVVVRCGARALQAAARPESSR